MAHKWVDWLHQPLSSWGSPNASQRGTKSESTHNWAHWRRNRCLVEGPQRFTKGNRIRSGSQVGGLATSLVQSSGSPTLQRGGGIPKWPTIGEVATSPLPSWGSQMLQSCGENRKWPTNGRIGYINFPHAILGGSPTLHSGGTKSEAAHNWADWPWNRCRVEGPWRVPNILERGAKSEVARKWADWLLTHAVGGGGVRNTSQRGRGGSQVGHIHRYNLKRGGTKGLYPKFGVPCVLHQCFVVAKGKGPSKQ